MSDELATKHRYQKVKTLSKTNASNNEYRKNEKRKVANISLKKLEDLGNLSRWK